MAAFAAGMASPENTATSPSKRPPAASVVTPAAVQCLFCVGSSLQGTLTSSSAGGGAALAGSVRIAGPAHMLQHLGKVHPRQLLQVLHTLQLLTGEEGRWGASFTRGNAAPLKAYYYPRLTHDMPPCTQHMPGLSTYHLCRPSARVSRPEMPPGLRLPPAAPPPGGPTLPRRGRFVRQRRGRGQAGSHDAHGPCERGRCVGYDRSCLGVHKKSTL